MVDAFHCTMPHLKNQKGPKSLLLSGANILPLSHSSMVVDDQKNLWILHGFNAEQDTNLDDVYCVKIFDNEDNKTQKVVLCPGQSRIQYLIDEHKEKVLDYEFRQRGDLPEPTSGHKCFMIDSENILFIGGHVLIDNVTEPGKSEQMPKHCIYTFNTKTFFWSKIMIEEDFSSLMSRSNFGACQKEDFIWICGGVKWRDDEMLFLPINELVCFDTKTLVIRKYDLGGFDDIVKIQNFSLSERPKTKELYIHGGDLESENKNTANGYNKNSIIFKIDLGDFTLTPLDDLPNYQSKVAVSGSTAMWFSKDICILLGGSEPELGAGGRNVLLYTNQTADIQPCDAEKCIVNDLDKNAKNQMIHCDRCQKEYHFCCDPKLAKVNKTPKNYLCPRCSQSKKRK